MRKPVSGVSALLIILTFDACSIAPTYERLAAPVADSWNGAATQCQDATIGTLSWESFIVDAELRRLVDVTPDNNRLLRQTLLDIEAARVQYRIQRADRAPGLNAVATGNRQWRPADLSADNRSEVVNNCQVGLALPEYELDFFGRVRSLTGTALQQYLASEEAACAARIALVVEVSQAYLSYDDALRCLALTCQTLVSRECFLALIDQRRVTGAATALDHQEALGLAEQAHVEQERSLWQKQQILNTPVLLLGSDDAAQAIPRGPERRPRLLQDIVPGTSSELIERHPDILAAEHRLWARNADIGVARTAFLPRISLIGSFGTSNMKMSDLLGGGSRSWNFLPTLMLPIFDSGRNRTSLSLVEMCKDPAVAACEGTIQTAFCGVADALAASNTLCRKEKTLRALANSSNEILKLTKAHYGSDVGNHLRYLNAQHSSFLNEAVFINNNAWRQAALVNPFCTFDGGWDEERSLVVHRDGRS